MTGDGDDRADKPEKPRDYEVGYGKPPKQYQWVPGQCGNRNGKPKGARSFDSEAKRLLMRKVPIKVNGKVRKVTVVQANFERILHKAMAGDTRAMMIIQDLARHHLPEEMKAFDELRDEDRVILARFFASRTPENGENSDADS